MRYNAILWLILWFFQPGIILARHDSAVLSAMSAIIGNISYQSEDDIYGYRMKVMDAGNGDVMITKVHKTPKTSTMEMERMTVTVTGPEKLETYRFNISDVVSAGLTSLYESGKATGPPEQDKYILKITVKPDKVAYWDMIVQMGYGSPVRSEILLWSDKTPAANKNLEELKRLLSNGNPPKE